jgi:hypothetical protein
MDDLITRLEDHLEGWPLDRKDWPKGAPVELILISEAAAALRVERNARESAQKRAKVAVAERDELRALLEGVVRTLMDAPGLPLENASQSDLAKWTDAISGLLISLHDYYTPSAALAARQDRGADAKHVFELPHTVKWPKL